MQKTTPKTRLRQLIEKLNGIDYIGELYNPVLVSVVGGECWCEVALLQDSTNTLLHQDLDRLQRLIDDYDSRMAKSISKWEGQV